MISGQIVVKMRGNVTQEILQKLDRGLDDVADAIEAKAVEFVAVDTGMLKKSIHVERGYLDKSVVADSPYAAYVEFGTNPHFPPVEPLKDWAHRVLGLNQKEAEQAAWRIARKIAREGTVAQPYMRPAFDFVVPQIAEIVKRQMN